MKFSVFTLFSIVLSVFGCQQNYLVEEVKSIPNGQWAYQDTLDFKFIVTDTTALYNIYVDFTHADTFPNQNLYAKFYTRFPNGKRLSTPLSFDFFTPQGTPTGKCSGGECQTKISIQQNAFFNQAGEYILTLEQFGRRNPVTGLKTIGLIVEKTGKK